MPHCIARTPGTNCNHSLKSPGQSSYRESYITQIGLKPIYFEVLSLATQNVLANMRVQDVFWKTTLSVEENLDWKQRTQLRDWWTVRIRLSLGSGGPD